MATKTVAFLWKLFTWPMTNSSLVEKDSFGVKRELWPILDWNSFWFLALWIWSTNLCFCLEMGLQKSASPHPPISSHPILFAVMLRTNQQATIFAMQQSSCLLSLLALWAVITGLLRPFYKQLKSVQHHGLTYTPRFQKRVTRHFSPSMLMQWTARWITTDVGWYRYVLFHWWV